MRRKTFDELKAEAARRDCGMYTSMFAKRILIATEEGIAIATEEDYLEIPIEELPGLQREIETAIKGAVERFTELPADEKYKMAKDKSMSYGKLRSIIASLEV